MDEYLGVIKLFVGNYVPVDYLMCAGQTLPIATYTALYSVIGTSYGGDGRSTFQLPDLRGRVPIGAGQGAGGLSDYQLGDVGGNEITQLGLQQLPPHDHTATFTPTGGGGGTSISAVAIVKAGTSGSGTPTDNPSGAYWGQSPSTGPKQSQDYTSASNVTMAADAVEVVVTGGGGGITGGSVAIGQTGAGQAFSNMTPYVACNYIICVNGTYPPRN